MNVRGLACGVSFAALLYFTFGSFGAYDGIAQWMEGLFAGAFLLMAFFVSSIFSSYYSRTKEGGKSFSERV